MELVALVFIWALWDVAKSAAKNARSDYGKSRGKAVKEGRKAAGGELPHSRERSLRRRHAAGYWGREALHGFPTARLGLHAGWLAHRTAHDQQQAIRDEAHTRHVETRADRLRNARDQRKRRDEARGEIDAIMADDPAPAGGVRERVRRAQDELARRRAQKQEEAARPSRQPDGQPEPGPYAVRDDATPDDSAHLRPGDTRCKDCGGTGGNKAGDDACPICRGWGSEADDPDSPLAADGTICAACGNPGTEDDPVLDAGSSPVHRSHLIAQQQAYADRRAANANTNGQNGTSDWPTNIPHRRNGDAPSPAPTEGNAMPTGTASEVTHSTVVASAQQYADAAEQDAATAESRRKELETMADQMQALDVDSASLSEVMELADLHRQQEATAKQIQEHAAALPKNLQQRHGHLDEAHREAPVRAAERGYYGEG